MLNRFFVSTFLSIVLFSCIKDSGDPKQSLKDSCAPSLLSANSGSTGRASVFIPDPIARSGIPNLSPSSVRLGEYVTQVSLENLTGKGVLEGTYVNVRNRVACGINRFGAYDIGNSFSYAYGDARFQEAMAYFFGDQYRKLLDTAQVLEPKSSVKIITHCDSGDNSYYARYGTSPLDVTEYVCLFDSAATPGASYADDSAVTIHELQHATTENTFNPNPQISLGHYEYDEAGALNEAISDFMALIYTAPMVTAGIDARIFSRWALGTFLPQKKYFRGAHRCPQYDSTYPLCSNFGTAPFSASNNTISYIYPDGLGWPFPDNFVGPGKVRNAFLTYSGQEEIHNAGVIMTGALWDVYEGLLANHGGDFQAAQILSAKLVMQALKSVPQPGSTVDRISPVNFRNFSSAVQDVGNLILNATDQTTLVGALTERGLIGQSGLSASWASVGPGITEPGLQIIDDPTKLRGMLYDMMMRGYSVDPSVVSQSIATKNSKLDPGEVVLVHFDIKNNSTVTAGAVQITVTAPPEVSLIGGEFNLGYVAADRAQIIYGKINGTAIVDALRGSAIYGVPTGNSYFQTNPYATGSWNTGLWMKVSPSAAHGKQIAFQIEAKPSNGPTAQVTFYATIQ